jgi:predicted metal-binding membrane protein
VPSSTARQGLATLIAVGAPAACALLALIAWSVSPYAAYVQHDHRPEDAVGGATALGLFLGGWLLMSAAMMLPTAASLLRVFAVTVQRRPDRHRLQAGLVAGFLTTWVATGYAFWSLDGVLHALVASVDWLEQRTHLLGGGILIAAGLFQFSSMKHRCLASCRSPRSFIYRHWRGGDPRADALRIGLVYGASCVGCCWALMLVMFAVGMANLAWMLALAAVMAVEKQARSGLRLVRPLGAALVIAGLVSVLA